MALFKRTNNNTSLLAEAEELSRSEFLRTRADRERILASMERRRRTVFVLCFDTAAIVMAIGFVLAYFAS